MMKLIIILIILLSNNSYAQKIIECADTSCEPNFDARMRIEKFHYSAIDAGVLNQENISVEIPFNLEKPRSSRIYVEQNNVLGQDISVNSKSKSENYNSADLVLITDFIRNLSINLSGYSGVNGKKASQICAEEFQKGNLGQFGENAYLEYENRRLFDLTIPRDECTFVDEKSLLDNNFTCDQADFQEIDVNNPSVIVERLRGKNKCIGLSYMDICLSKTVEVTCTWRIKYTDPPTVAGQFSTSNNYPDVHKKVFRMSEQEYLTRRNISGELKYFCDHLTYNPIIDSPPVDIVKNGNFYFDLRDWVNESISWVDEKMKLNGSPIQTVRPKAEQILNTLPGREYRVQATFLKAREHDYVSGGYVSIWNNLNKDELIKKEYIHEKGAIKGVFLTSDEAPYHFGYVNVGITPPSKEFIIKNKDDRVAKNCSPPFIFGDTSHFFIESESCGSSDLEVGESCSVVIRATPLSIGTKKTYIRRNCSDEFGNTTTQLNEEISLLAWANYLQNSGDSTGSYVDGNFWRRMDFQVGNGIEWGRCTPDYELNKRCNLSAPVSVDYQSNELGVWTSGFNPQGMTLPSNIPEPTQLDFPIVNNSSIAPIDQFNFKNIDFIFTATTNRTILELGSILKYNSGYFDGIVVTQLASSSGPDIKPPADNLCPDPQNTPGCLSGELGNGYYELFGQPSFVETNPGYDQTFFTVPEGSDWNIRYVEVGNSCPQYYTKIKTGHLASNIAYDENDELCDDISIPEDPASKIVSWQFIGFERKPEFGTELIQCTLGNCLVETSVRDLSRNLIEINPGSGTNGTQQGQGTLFVYDVEEVNMLAENGKGGRIGEDDLFGLSGQRICAKIKDAETEGLESLFAENPSVEFRRYNWKPLKVKENGNFGITPANNGKKINILKKMDSSSRYLLRHELF